MKKTIDKVQLIFPPSDLQLTGVGFYGSFPPLGLIELATFVKQHNPSIEIESEDESKLKRILEEVNVLEILKEPMAEIMRKIKK